MEKSQRVVVEYPPICFRAMNLNGEAVAQASEKPQEGWINASVFVFEPAILDSCDECGTFHTFGRSLAPGSKTNRLSPLR